MSDSDAAREHPESAARVVIKAHEAGGDFRNAWDVLVAAVGNEQAREYLHAEGEGVQALLVLRDLSIADPTAAVGGEKYTFDPMGVAYLKYGLCRSLARLIDLALETDAPTITSGSERIGLAAFAKACRNASLVEGDS